MTLWKSAVYDNRYNPPKKRIREEGLMGRIIIKSLLEKWIENYTSNSKPMDFDRYDLPKDLEDLSENIIVPRRRTFYEKIKENFITLDEKLGGLYDRIFGEREPIFKESGKISACAYGRKIKGRL